MKVEYAVLVAEAREGDEQAMAALYRATYNLAYYVALQLVKNREDALDVMQDAYIRAFGRLRTLKDPARFESWLCRIVANTAKNQIKRKKPLLFGQLTDEEGEAEPDFEDDTLRFSPEEQLETQETARHVREIVDELSDEQRMVVLMYYFGDQSVAEIARDLGCPENTVKSRLNYARQKIKRGVQRLREEGIPLYGAAPLAWFGSALGQDAYAAHLPAEIARPLFSDIAAELLPALGAGAAGAGAAATAGTAGAAGISGKVVAGISAGVVLLGAVAGIAIGTQMSKQPSSVPVSAPQSVSQSAGQVQVSSTPTPVPQPAPEEPGLYDTAWRKIYYDVAAANLRAGEMVASQVLLYYTSVGEPLMSIRYGIPTSYTYNNETSYYANTEMCKMWKIENGKAVLVFDRPLPMDDMYYDLGVNTQSGNPVLEVRPSSNVATTYEIIDGTRMPLFEIDYNNQDEYQQGALYTYADDKHWSPEEQWTQKPLSKMHLSSYDALLPLMSLRFSPDTNIARQQLSDYFLGSYTPSVPDEAPDWVEYYLQTMHCQWLFSYYPGETNSTAQDTTTSPYIALYMPATAKSAPILRFFNEGVSMGILDVRYDNVNLHEYEVIWEGGTAYYADAQGQLVREHSYVGGHSWTLCTSNGDDPLFFDTVPPGDSTYSARSEFDTATFDTQEDAIAWVEAHRIASFERHGVTPPLTPLEGTEYLLPQNATWAELEPLLLDALCTHAKAIGQWGSDAN